MIWRACGAPILPSDMAPASNAYGLLRLAFSSAFSARNNSSATNEHREVSYPFSRACALT